MNPFLRGLKEGFHNFGLRVNSAVTFIVMVLVYFVGIGITALINKVGKKNLLDISMNKKSYWIRKEKENEDYRRIF